VRRAMASKMRCMARRDHGYGGPGKNSSYQDRSVFWANDRKTGYTEDDLEPPGWRVSETSSADK
jgi:hypothetical protein